jgi:hypothetical protein
VPAALIKVADADAAINHTAVVHLADLQEKQADIRGAAQSYQNALRLDTALSDTRSTASDWFNSILAQTKTT